jgi:hypothetical protein
MIKLIEWVFGQIGICWSAWAVRGSGGMRGGRGEGSWEVEVERKGYTVTRE